MTNLEDEGKVVYVLCLDCKAFDTFSHNVLLEKLSPHGLGGCTLFSKTLSGWLGTESGGDGSYIQLGAAHYWCSPELSIWASSDL